jgi:hypothetical protein
MDTLAQSAGNERLMGVCIGIAILADILIQAGLMEQDELTQRLTEATLLTPGAERQASLRAILWLVENYTTGL